MKAAQIIGMWRLIANGSVLLKILMAMAFVCVILVLSFYSQGGKTIAALGVWGLLMMLFINTFLILNSAELVEKKRSHLMPQFRQTLVITHLIWFLVTTIYVCLLLKLGGSPNKTIPFYILANVFIFVPALLASLAIAVSFDRRIMELMSFVFFILYIPLVRLGYIGEISNATWAVSFLPVAIGVSVFALAFLLTWSSSPINKPKIFTGLVNRIFANYGEVAFIKNAGDVITLQIFRRYSGLYTRLLAWCLTGAFVIFFSTKIEDGSTFQHAGAAIILLLWLICLSQNNSIYCLRYLWLKGVGNRVALFKIWETKKVQELLVINASLVLATTAMFCWLSSSTELIVPITLTILVVSFFASYLVALIMSYNFSFLTAQFGVFVLNVLFIINIFLLPKEMDVGALSYAGGTILVLTVILRAQLKKQVLRLDWLLIPKPKSNGF